MSGSWGIDLAKLPGTKFQATFQDSVVRIDAETVKRTARGVNKAHDIYFFDNDPELRDKIVSGKVVLLTLRVPHSKQQHVSSGAEDAGAFLRDIHGRMVTTFRRADPSSRWQPAASNAA